MENVQRVGDSDLSVDLSETLAGYRALIPSDWYASTNNLPRFTIRITPILTPVETCRYTASNAVIRVAAEVEVKVINTETNEEIGAIRLSGQQPAPCQSEETFPTDAFTKVQVGSLPTPEQVAPWLQTTVACASADQPLDSMLTVACPVFNLAFSPNGETLAIVGQDSIVKLLNVAEGLTLKGRLAQSQAAITALAFSPDGKVLATGSKYGAVKLWDLETGLELKTISETMENPVVIDGLQSYYSIVSLSFSSDGKLLAAFNSNVEIHVWDVTTGATAFKLQNSSGSRAVFSPDSQTLAWVSVFEVNFVNAVTGKYLASHRTETGASSVLSFSNDGQTLAVEAFTTCQIELFEVSPFKKINDVGDNGCYPLSITDTAFSADGKLVAFAKYNWDGNTVNQAALLQIWDAQTGQELNTMNGHQANVTDIAFSPDGEILASGSWDGTITLWDVTTGQPHASFTNSLYKPQ